MPFSVLGARIFFDAVSSHEGGEFPGPLLVGWEPEATLEWSPGRSDAEGPQVWEEAVGHWRATQYAYLCVHEYGHDQMVTMPVEMVGASDVC